MGRTKRYISHSLQQLDKFWEWIFSNVFEDGDTKNWRNFGKSLYFNWTNKEHKVEPRRTFALKDRVNVGREKIVDIMYGLGQLHTCAELHERKIQCVKIFFIATLRDSLIERDIAIFLLERWKMTTSSDKKVVVDKKLQVNNRFNSHSKITDGVAMAKELTNNCPCGSRIGMVFQSKKSTWYTWLKNIVKYDLTEFSRLHPWAVSFPAGYKQLYHIKMARWMRSKAEVYIVKCYLIGFFHEKCLRNSTYGRSIRVAFCSVMQQ